MKTKTKYIYEIKTLDYSNKPIVEYNKSFYSHGEAKEYIDNLKMGNAYDMHHLKVHSRFSYITIKPYREI